MKLNVAKKIVEAADVIGSMEVKLRERYPCHDMRDDTTTAIVYDDQNDFLVALAYAAGCIGENAVLIEDDDLNLDDFCDEVRRFRFDQLGHGRVAF